MRTGPSNCNSIFVFYKISQQENKNCTIIIILSQTNAIALHIYEIKLNTLTGEDKKELKRPKRGRRKETNEKAQTWEKKRQLRRRERIE